ncbi:MAG: hypothetical protein KKD21_03685 [Proteobacteria bacterium]|nr:hypothetical protein [Pseudomonadota bacterium]MBU1696131.1 hypothetical protein [Pseudomonadota bacterium]
MLNPAKRSINKPVFNELCRLSPDQAYLLLKRLAKKGLLCARGTRKGAFYTPG